MVYIIIYKASLIFVYNFLFILPSGVVGAINVSYKLLNARYFSTSNTIRFSVFKSFATIKLCNNIIWVE